MRVLRSSSIVATSFLSVSWPSTAVGAQAVASARTVFSFVSSHDRFLRGTPAPTVTSWPTVSPLPTLHQPQHPVTVSTNTSLNTSEVSPPSAAPSMTVMPTTAGNTISMAPTSSNLTARNANSIFPSSSPSSLVGRQNQTTRSNSSSLDNSGNLTAAQSNIITVPSTVPVNSTTASPAYQWNQTGALLVPSAATMAPVDARASNLTPATIYQNTSLVPSLSPLSSPPPSIASPSLSVNETTSIGQFVNRSGIESSATLPSNLTTPTLAIVNNITSTNVTAVSANLNVTSAPSLPPPAYPSLQQNQTGSAVNTSGTLPLANTTTQTLSNTTTAVMAETIVTSNGTSTNSSANVTTVTSPNETSTNSSTMMTNVPSNITLNNSSTNMTIATFNGISINSSAIVTNVTSNETSTNSSTVSTSSTMSLAPSFLLPSSPPSSLGSPVLLQHQTTPIGPAVVAPTVSPSNSTTTLAPTNESSTKVIATSFSYNATSAPALSPSTLSLSPFLSSPNPTSPSGKAFGAARPTSVPSTPTKAAIRPGLVSSSTPSSSQLLSSWPSSTPSLSRSSPKLSSLSPSPIPPQPAPLSKTTPLPSVLPKAPRSTLAPSSRVFTSNTSQAATITKVPLSRPPTAAPSRLPTPPPSFRKTTHNPTSLSPPPAQHPTQHPTQFPTYHPTHRPTHRPTHHPSLVTVVVPATGRPTTPSPPNHDTVAIRHPPDNSINGASFRSQPSSSSRTRRPSSHPPPPQPLPERPTAGTAAPKAILHPGGIFSIHFNLVQQH